MRRRRIALAAIALPAMLAQAQPSVRMPRIGILGDSAGDDVQIAALRDGLRSHGYVDGRTATFVERYAHGETDRMPQLAAELVASRVDVIVTGGRAGASAALAASRTIPVVFSAVGDPVGMGIAASLARPGGRATGLSNLVVSLSGKQLEQLKATVPTASRVAIFHNPGNSAPSLKETRAAAPALKLDVTEVPVASPADLARAFAAARERRAQGVLALSDPVFGASLPQLARAALESRLATLYSRREFVTEGGLVSYGPSFTDQYRRAAGYVDRILKGAKPGDLPIAQPERFELAVNLKTALALGLTIPKAIVGQADLVVPA